MGNRWDLVAAAAVLVAVGVGGCGASGPTTDFCTGYGDAMHELVVAARNYPSDPDQFAATLHTTMSTLDDLRATAPDERLREAFNTASFTFSVFSQDDALADFLTRADFSDNAMVLACAEYGVELSPADG